MNRVITIHGISTDGKWQENIAPVLWPHFEPVSVKYPHYRWLGPLDMVLEPIILFPGLVVLMLAGKGERLPEHWYWILLCFLLIAARWGTRFRQKKALRKLLNEADTAIFPANALYVIAHSFGTYLFARALREHGPLNVNRIVLTGCILYEGFDWKGLLRSKNRAFEAIRSDVGRRDLPVMLSGLCHWLNPDWGKAGRAGFELVSGWIHDIRSLQEECSSCKGYSEPVRIHNVFNDDGGHSTSFNGVGYAAWYWLPFFWGIGWGEYQEFVDVCWAFATAKPGDQLYVRALQDIRTRPWAWAGGTLDQYVESQITKVKGLVRDAAHLEELRDSGIFYTCKAIRDALEARSRKLERMKRLKGHDSVIQNLKDADDALILALHPIEAVRMAVKSIAAQESTTS